MKQIEQNYRTGELLVADTPTPRVGAGGVLVATRCSLISSGTEKQIMDLAKSSLVGKAAARPDLVRQTLRKVKREGLLPTIEKVLAKLDTPIPLGYSVAGEALEIGSGVNGISPGDRVACAGAGFANHAEYNVTPKNLTVAIPENVDDEEGSFVTIGAIALQGVRLAAPTLGERVVVIGLGLIGILTVQLLKASGCRVLGFDPVESRAQLAKRLGADFAISDGLPEAVASFTKGFGADAVIVAASSKSSEPINVAAEISRIKGRIVVVGMVGMTIDREPFYKRELDLRMSMSYGPGRHDADYELGGHDYPLAYVRWTERRNMEAFLGLVSEGRVTPKALISHRFSISEAEKAYALMESGEPHLAILLTYPEETRSQVVRGISRAPARESRDSVGVAFVGFGNYAKAALYPALRKSSGIALTTVVASTGLSAAHAARKYGFARAATDFSEAVGDPDTDAIFIATRHDSHAGIAAAALRAGKHVFCEKPLALDSAGLMEVAQAARETRAILAAGFNRRFAPLLMEARAALEPRIGPLVMLYRINAGSIPRDSWIQRDEGGGRIIGEVCHFVDALTYLCGSNPVDAYAACARDHADAVSIVIRFSDGSTGAIVYSSLGDPSVAKEHIEAFAGGCVVQLDDFRRLAVTARGKCTVKKRAQDKGQSGLVSAFLAAARGDRDAPIPLDQLIAVTDATFAIEESLRIGGPVSLSETA